MRRAELNTQKAITRSSSLRVIAVSARRRSSPIRVYCLPISWGDSACSQCDGRGFRLESGEFAFSSALSLRPRSLHAGVIAIDPGLRKEVLIAIAMEG